METDWELCCLTHALLLGCIDCAGEGMRERQGETEREGEREQGREGGRGQRMKEERGMGRRRGG